MNSEGNERNSRVGSIMNPKKSIFLFIRRTKWYKFEDWFWLKSHDLFENHAYASERPAVIKSPCCVFLLRLILFLL